MDPRAIADILIEAERPARRWPRSPARSSSSVPTRPTKPRPSSSITGSSAGEHLIGAKLGLTSRVKRAALGIDEPVFGRLTSGMLLPAAEPIPLEQLIHPRAEPEIAYLIGRDLDGPVTPAGVLAATDAVVPRSR